MLGTRWHRIGLVLWALSLAPFLGGCFDLTQNLSVAAKGNGRLVTTFGLDRRFAGLSGGGMSPIFCEKNPDGGGLFEDDENIKRTALGYREAGGFAYCDISIDFDDIKQLAPGDIIRKRLPPGPWVPTRSKFLEVRSVGNGILQLRQDFHLGGDQARNKKDRRLFENYFAEQLRDRRLRVSFTAPRILSSNGAKAKDSETVHWSRPMLSLFDPNERHNNILIIEFKIGPGGRGT